MTDKLDLKAIRKRCEAASEGPWEWHGDVLSAKNACGEALSIYHETKGYDSYFVELDCEQKDRDFIAHARTDIPALIADIEWLREELHEVGMVAEREAQRRTTLAELKALLRKACAE